MPILHNEPTKLPGQLDADVFFFPTVRPTPIPIAANTKMPMMDPMIQSRFLLLGGEFLEDELTGGLADRLCNGDSCDVYEVLEYPCFPVSVWKVSRGDEMSAPAGKTWYELTLWCGCCPRSKRSRNTPARFTRSGRGVLSSSFLCAFSAARDMSGIFGTGGRGLAFLQVKTRRRDIPDIREINEGAAL